MNPPSLDVANFLLNDGIVSAGQIFIGEEPADVTGIVVVVADTGSVAINPKWARDTVKLQIRCEGTPHDYIPAYQQMDNIKNYLLGKNSDVVGDVDYIRFIMITDTTFVGKGEQAGPVFTSNWEVTREWTTAIGNRLPL